MSSVASHGQGYGVGVNLRTGLPTFYLLAHSPLCAASPPSPTPHPDNNGEGSVRLDVYNPIPDRLFFFFSN